jgi:hypothetical protein
MGADFGMFESMTLAELCVLQDLVKSHKEQKRVAVEWAQRQVDFHQGELTKYQKHLALEQEYFDALNAGYSAICHAVVGTVSTKNKKESWCSPSTAKTI